MSSAKRNGGKSRRVGDDPVPAEMDHEEDLDDGSDVAVSDGEDAGDSGSEIEAVFEGFMPKEGDFHGIKNLLNQLLTGCDVNLSDLADTVLAQPDVSSVLKVGDADDEVFGVISPLSLKQHSKKPSIQSLRELILTKCDEFGSVETKARLAAALGASGKSNVALLVNERMINLPQELAISLHGALQEDLKEAAKADSTYKFDQFVIMCKSVESALRSSKGSTGQKKKKKKADGASAAAAAESSDGNEQIFINLEDELFLNHCTCSYSFPLSESTWISRKGGVRERPSRTIMLMTSGQLRQAWKELEGLLT
ncbi:protein BCCIP homolog [Sycon ciliatum]|uniref:protein BCCIP homolog n=1 Tax=Sycon ciliatum TaxID=27933 RepID=UPI0031F6AD51|eukprot:scpid44840/ scgid20800/ Protein BCCIP homolog